MMGRIILAVLAGLIGWMAFATLCGLVLRVAWPAYVAAEPMFAFTLPMLAARLAIGAASTIVGGGIVTWIARGQSRAVWAMGAVLLLLFVPQHIYLFAKFPLWYHALFLVSLVPLTLAGGRFVKRPKPPSASTTNS
jgi:hypothetical protein